MSVLNDMFSMFDAGVTVEEICKNSMYSLSMVSAVYDMWKAEIEETKMTRKEALKICKEALEKHEGGKEAYLNILEDLIRLNEYEEGDEDERCKD